MNRKTLIFSNILILILSSAIIIHGILSYISKQNELKVSIKKIESEKDEREKDKNKQTDLGNCIAEAKTQFERLRNLNSVEATMENGEKAHKWNTTEIKLQIEDQFNKDRDFCLRLYK